MSEATTTTAPPAQTFLRILVLLFGVAGGLSSAFCGFVWYSAIKDETYQEKLTEAKTGMLSMYDETTEKYQKYAGAATDFLERHEHITLGWKILMAGLPVGIIAGLLGYLRIVPLLAAALMIAEFASPALFGFDVKAFIFTSPLAIGALLATFIRTKGGASKSVQRAQSP